MPTYTQDTFVRVEPFTTRREGEEVILGRPEAGLFLAVAPEAIELLEALAAGKTVGQVSDQYHEKYGEVPDLEDFLCFMETQGIVKPKEENGGSSFNADSKPMSVSRQRYHFSNFPQTLARRLFGGPVLTFNFVLVALAAIALIQEPSLRPRTQDLYFPDHRVLCAVLLAIASYGTIFIHELGHLVAARAVGVNSRMGLSHRLWFLVAETDLTGLWGVPKRQRYLPLLAGMLIDLTSASLLVLLMLAHARHLFTLSALAIRLSRAMVLTYLLRIIWQFFFYMRTDLYYVVTTVLSCKNLLRDTEVFLRNQLARYVSKIRSQDQSGIPPQEMRVIRGYAWFWLGGRIMAWLTLFIVTIPVMMRYGRNLSGVFRTGYAANPANFVDAVLLAGFFFVPFTAGFSMWIASLIRKEGDSR